MRSLFISLISIEETNTFGDGDVNPDLVTAPDDLGKWCTRDPFNMGSQGDHTWGTD